MRFRLEISDDTADVYQDYAANLNGKGSVEDVLAAQLEHFKAVRPTDRIIVVDSRHRDRLEQLLPAGGSIRDAADLVSRVDRVAKVEVAEIRVPFTVAELEELSYRARHQGRTLKQLVEEAVATWHEQFFNWPDTRTCSDCGKTIKGGEVQAAAKPITTPAPPQQPPPPEPAPVDIAGKVAANRSIPGPIRPIPLGGAMKPPV